MHTSLRKRSDNLPDQRCGCSHSVGSALCSGSSSCEIFGEIQRRVAASGTWRMERGDRTCLCGLSSRGSLVIMARVRGCFGSNVIPGLEPCAPTNGRAGFEKCANSQSGAASVLPSSHLGRQARNHLGRNNSSSSRALEQKEGSKKGKFCRERNAAKQLGQTARI